MTYEMNIKRVNLFTVVIPVILYISCLVLSFCVESRIFVLTMCLLPEMYMLFMTATLIAIGSKPLSKVIVQL